MFDVDSLKQWFLNEKRDLPWRNNPSPYAVWISEMMLQQTQVAVVIPYFERWMKRFPTIELLAQAHIDEVIKMWEGLGYYSRARYLHAGAQTIMSLFNGELPSSSENLKTIKGLGDYTIGAIRSFAFHQRAPAVDGNVIRVLARYFLIEQDVSLPATRRIIWSLAEKILPDAEPWVFNESLIELGATICKRKPHCVKCPLKESCQAFLRGKAEELPIKSSRVKAEWLYRAVAIVNHGEMFLVRRGKKGEIMSDLHEFPFFETSPKGISSKNLKEKTESQFLLKLKHGQEMEEVQHSFTRYYVRLRPVYFTAEEKVSIHDYCWASLNELKEMAFSSGHRRILHMLTF
jgi:A/G-specific adenine glycosylase